MTEEPQPCSDAVCFRCGEPLGGWGHHVTYDGLLQFVCAGCLRAGDREPPEDHDAQEEL